MRFRGEGARQFEKIAPNVCGERIDRASNPPLRVLAGTDVATAELVVCIGHRAELCFQTLRGSCP
ncbi:hypothetical protein EV128_105137 [Rhizobium azibense]|nr:hypothetical protein EV128_105137 [Rhizobium azibense]